MAMVGSSSTTRILAMSDRLPTQVNGERGALARAALALDSSAVRGNHVLHEAQAEAGTLDLPCDLRRGAKELVEDPTPVRVVDADPLIADADHELAAAGARVHPDRLLAGR